MFIVGDVLFPKCWIENSRNGNTTFIWKKKVFSVKISCAKASGRKTTNNKNRVWLYKERKFSSAFSLQSFVYLRLQQRSIRHLAGLSLLVRNKAKLTCTHFSYQRHCGRLCFVIFFLCYYFFFLLFQATTTLDYYYCTTIRINSSYCFLRSNGEVRPTGTFSHRSLFLLSRRRPSSLRLFSSCVAATEYRLI